MSEIFIDEFNSLAEELKGDIDPVSAKRIRDAIDALNGIEVPFAIIDPRSGRIGARTRIPLENEKVFIARNEDGLIVGALSLAERPTILSTDGEPMLDEKILLVQNIGTTEILGGTGDALVLEALREAKERGLPIQFSVPEDLRSFFDALGFPMSMSAQYDELVLTDRQITLRKDQIDKLLDSISDAGIMGAFVPDSYRFVSGTVRRSQAKARRKARSGGTRIFEPKEVREYEIWPPVDDAGDSALSLRNDAGDDALDNVLDGPLEMLDDDAVKNLLGPYADRFLWEDGPEADGLGRDAPVVYKSGKTVVAFSTNPEFDWGEWNKDAYNRIANVVEELQKTYPVGPVLVTSIPSFGFSELGDAGAWGGFQLNPGVESRIYPWAKQIFSGLTGQQYGSNESQKVIVLTDDLMKKVLNDPTELRSISIARESDDTIRYLLAHEWGHLLDGSLRNTSFIPPYAEKYEEFRENFSTYGKTNPHEGFAEAFAEYFLGGGNPKSPLAQWYANLSSEEKGLGTPPEETLLNINLTKSSSVTTFDTYSGEDSAISIRTDDVFYASQFQKKLAEFSAEEGSVSRAGTAEERDALLDRLEEEDEESDLPGGQGVSYAREALVSEDDDQNVVFVAKTKNGNIAGASSASVAESQRVRGWARGGEDGDPVEFGQTEELSDDYFNEFGEIYEIAMLGSTEVMHGAASSLMRAHIVEAADRGLGMILESTNSAESFYGEVLGMKNIGGPMYALTVAQVAELADKLRLVTPITADIKDKNLENK